jgi:hypothetical protein
MGTGIKLDNSCDSDPSHKNLYYFGMRTDSDEESSGMIMGCHD